MSTPGNVETEIKLAVPQPLTETHARLTAAGLTIWKARVFEENLVLDTPTRSLRQNKELIRIRTVEGKGVLTYKGRPETGEHKTREEIESPVDHPRQVELILNRLGLQPAFRYQKYRTEYKRGDEPGVVTLDETPIGNYLEVEGEPDWINATAARLGFLKHEYITASYGKLYLTFCDRIGLAPGHMVFADPT